MDLARWWNTKGQLGSLGEAALRRGFPRTHHFAQARSVFAVASARCAELFSSTDSVSLFQLPEVVEEELEAKWEEWLDTASAWEPFFQNVAAISSHDLPAVLQGLELASADHVARLVELERYLKPRAVALPSAFSGSKADMTLLAIGFACGEVGVPRVPYMQKGRA